MKKVLVVTYSQSGQLNEIVNNVISSFGNDIQTDIERIEPEPGFNFPWKGDTFYDAMPECVELISGNNKPYKFNPGENYDLVILGYPIWFLSPPTPITTFLKSESGKQVLKGKPVLTVIGARNMWVSAQEEIKKMLSEAGAKHAGNIALCDHHNNLLSVVTIIYWMSTGKKDKYLGIFPKPGVSDEDIASATRFSPSVKNAVLSGSYSNLQQELINTGAIKLNSGIVSVEERGKKIFRLWSKFILKKGGPGDSGRVGRLHMFKWYLLFVIFIVSPFGSLYFFITRPIFIKKIKRKLQYYSGIELKSEG